MDRRSAGAAAWLTLVALVLAACSDVPAGDATTVGSTTTVAAVPSSTSTGLPFAVTIPATEPLRWEAGMRYETSRFWAPISFDPPEEGWLSRGATELWIHLEYAGDLVPENHLDLSLFVADPEIPFAEAADHLMANDVVWVQSGPDPVTVAGHEGVVLEVAVAGGPPYPACDEQPFYGGFSHFSGPGVHLLPDGMFFFGVVDCAAARVWYLDVSGSTIVAIAGTRGTLDEVSAIVERLMATVTLGG